MQKLEQRSGLTPIFAELAGLICEQKRELEALELPLGFGASEVIFKWYLRSDRFKDAYREAMAFSLIPHNAEEYDRNGRDFAGRLFEDIAYYVMVKKQSDAGNILLSPERTLEFWKRLYPKNSELVNPYGSGSLAGLSVPDGIIITELGQGNRILNLCEYTISEKTKVENKKNGNDKDKKNYPNVLAQTSVLYVAPNGVFYNDNGVVRLPFSASDFRTFFNYLYNVYPGDPDTATLLDMQRESRRQFARVLNKSKNGTITGEDVLDTSKIGKLTKEDSAYFDKVLTLPKLI